MKHIVKIVIAVLCACSCLVLSFYGCGSNIADDVIPSPSHLATPIDSAEASNGPIQTESDSTYTTYDPDYTPRPKNPAELSDAQIDKIKTDYFAFISDENPIGFTAKDVFLGEYFGMYSNGIALFISHPGAYYLQQIFETEIAGHIFVYKNSHFITFCKDGRFMELSQAYSEGLLTEQDIRDIHFYFMGS